MGGERVVTRCISKMDRYLFLFQFFFIYELVFVVFPTLKLSEYMHPQCLIRGFILDLIRICIRKAMQNTIV